jgi:acetate CoA/acetoacetate CoA-transferase beta subunit
VGLIITDRAVFKVEKDALLLTELMSPYTVEDILGSTEATVRLSDQLITIP